MKHYGFSRKSIWKNLETFPINSNYKMEEKKSFEALQYSYENAGQFRAIAAVLGYSEEYRNGDIIFSKGNETYTYPLNTLKLGNLGDNRESLLEQSKKRIIKIGRAHV